MSAIPRLLFVLALVVVPIFIVGTSSGLPDPVASHFGVGGLPNGWMGRDGYVALMVALSTLLPLFVVAVTGLLPERRQATRDWLINNACTMGIILTLFLAALHALLLEANALTPARLPEPPFFAVLAAFVVTLIVWIAWTRQHFRRPD
jgi:hypothetical protein